MPKLSEINGDLSAHQPITLMMNVIIEWTMTLHKTVWICNEMADKLNADKYTDNPGRLICLMDIQKGVGLND